MTLVLSLALLTAIVVSQIKGTSSEELTPVLVTDNGDAEIKESEAERTTPPSSCIPDV